jgi:UDP-N-acetyl-D-mannosaminuronic acid dehydrogenase
MKEKGITDVSRIGLYGLTYKEDVDDVRESPTLQILESMEQHLAFGVKVYDPVVRQTNLVPGQYVDFEDFLDAVDMVVIMVGHNHIKKNLDKLKNKVILDTRNICSLEKTYKL